MPPQKNLSAKGSSTLSSNSGTMSTTSSGGHIKLTGKYML
jgi:hypothetical protein